MKRTKKFNTLIIPIALLVFLVGATHAGEPYPSAPLCPDSGEAHNNGRFHTLWNGKGCHYDHEHGQKPFTPEVAAVFPGFDLFALLGNVGIGHTNPSSEHENTSKHGGFKWHIDLSHDTGCNGVEGATVGVDASAIQFHSFGNLSDEMETRIHSAVALVRQCKASNPTDYGYIFINQHQDYGQRTAPYQGINLQYPDRPIPAYLAGLKPYFTVECYGGPAQCSKRPTLQSIINTGRAVSIWSSEPDNLIGSGSPLLGLLFVAVDSYQAIDASDLVYPFTFRWLCSADGGLTYNPAGCKFNNSMRRVNQIAGTIPAEWDNLAGFDTEPEMGRITAEGYVTRFGALNLACTGPGEDCHPIKLVRAFVGKYSSFLTNTKDAIPDPLPPDYDIYFQGVSSGWIGAEN